MSQPHSQTTRHCRFSSYQANARSCSRILDDADSDGERASPSRAASASHAERIVVVVLSAVHRAKSHSGRLRAGRHTAAALGRHCEFKFKEQSSLEKFVSWSLVRLVRDGVEKGIDPPANRQTIRINATKLFIHPSPVPEWPTGYNSLLGQKNLINFVQCFH